MSRESPLVHNHVCNLKKLIWWQTVEFYKPTQTIVRFWYVHDTYSAATPALFRPSGHM